MLIENPLFIHFSTFTTSNNSTKPLRNRTSYIIFKPVFFYEIEKFLQSSSPSISQIGFIHNIFMKFYILNFNVQTKNLIYIIFSHNCNGISITVCNPKIWFFYPSYWTYISVKHWFNSSMDCSTNPHMTSVFTPVSENKGF